MTLPSTVRDVSSLNEGLAEAHHSWDESALQSAGEKSLAVTLGALFCTNLGENMVNFTSSATELPHLMIAAHCI